MPINNASAVLENLLAKGIITKEQMKDAAGYTKEELECASMLHSVFCRGDHEGDECLFYEGGGDSAPALKEWVENATSLAKATDMEMRPTAELALVIAGQLEL